MLIIRYFRQGPIFFQNENNLSSRFINNPVAIETLKTTENIR